MQEMNHQKQFSAEYRTPLTNFNVGPQAFSLQEPLSDILWLGVCFSSTVFGASCFGGIEFPSADNEFLQLGRGCMHLNVQMFTFSAVPV